VLEVIADLMAQFNIGPHNPYRSWTYVVFDQEEFAYRHIIEEAFPWVHVRPGDWHIKANALSALLQTYGPAGLNSVFEELGFRKDLSNALVDFDESYYPFYVATIALMHTLIVYLRTQHTQSLTILTIFDHISAAATNPSTAPTLRFWFAFLTHYAPAIILLHRAIRTGEYVSRRLS